MNRLLDLQKNPVAMSAIGIGFALGIGLGLLYGWVINPVRYVDTDPSYLRADFKLDYVRMAVDSYALTRDTERAKVRAAPLGEEAIALVKQLEGEGTGQDVFNASNYRALLESDLPAESGGGEPAAPSLASRVRGVLPWLCAGVAVLAMAAGGVIFFMRRGAAAAPRARPTVSPALGVRADEVLRGERVGPTGPPAEPPIQQFMTTYALGDDRYDDSFSIDAPSGSFLGECGVGISETIGVGDPKKVTAFEVWLFDKNDIRTVTKVLMSEHTFRDEALRSKLSAKGEPVLALPGESVTMETASLRVTARVVDMAYGGGALPPNSFFERLTVELAAWQKPAVTQPVAEA